MRGQIETCEKYFARKFSCMCPTAITIISILSITLNTRKFYYTYEIMTVSVLNREY